MRGSNPKAPALMVFAHTDSLGMIVKKIEENGYLRIERVGGVPERILAASNVLLQAKGARKLKALLALYRIT